MRAPCWNTPVRTAIQRRKQQAPEAWTELLLGERTHISIPDGEPASWPDRNATETAG